VKLESFIALLNQTEGTLTEGKSPLEEANPVLPLKTVLALQRFSNAFHGADPAVKALTRILEAPEPGEMSERADIAIARFGNEVEFVNALGKVNTSLNAANESIGEAPARAELRAAALAHLIDACEGLKVMIMVSRRALPLAMRPPGPPNPPKPPFPREVA
jgi:hypothetical protein